MLCITFDKKWVGLRVARWYQKFQFGFILGALAFTYNVGIFYGHWEY
jgi:hypothetical protein